MNFINLNKLFFALAIGTTILSFGDMASAQSRRQNERDRQRLERDQRGRTDVQGNLRVTERRVNNANFVTGYQQGVIAGEFDRRKKKYNQSNVYRGSGASPNSGDPTQADYLYRQGYLEGYSDGYSGRRKY